MSNPFLDRIARKGGSGHGRLSEKIQARKMGARLTPASGALQGAKSDATLKNFRMEMKSTVHESLSVKLDWLKKISEEALPLNQIPALSLSFVTPEGKPQTLTNAEWVAIPRWAFQELLDD
jgi:hypothetical protein